MSQFSFASKMTWSPGQTVGAAFHTWNGYQLIQTTPVSEVTVFYANTKKPTGIMVTDLNGVGITPSYIDESYKNDSGTNQRMVIIGLPSASAVKISMSLLNRDDPIPPTTSLVLMSGSNLDLMSGSGTLDLYAQ